MRLNLLTALALAGAAVLCQPALADTVGAVQPGTAATQSSMAGCIYNSPAPAPTTGQQVALQCDSSGRLITSASVSANITVNPVTTTTTAPTITTGGTFQSVLASNGSRNGCLIQNPVAATETLFVFFGANASATIAKSISLSPGSAASCAVGGLAVATDNISATATTTGHALVVDAQ